MKTLKTIAVAAGALLATGPVHAAEWPTSPLQIQLQRPDGLESVGISCDLKDATHLHCLFATVTISSRRADKPMSADSKSELAAELLKDESKPEVCKGALAMVDGLQSGNFSDDMTRKMPGLLTATPKRKAAILQQVAPVADFCRTPNQQTAMAFVEAMTNPQPHCCTISAVPFEHDFTTDDGGQTWLSNEGPTGTCKVYWISRLDRIDSYNWQYSTRKVVTGKDADPSLPGCSILDQTEYVYKPAADTLPPDAEFIDWTTWLIHGR